MSTYKSYCIVFSLLIISCTPKIPPNSIVAPRSFEKEVNGKLVKLYTLTNKNNITVQITNYGARVVSLWTPDKNGKFEDIVLGFDNIDGYLNANEKYYGAQIGRFANRITKGAFTLNDSTYTLAKNNGENHLHGGGKGFESRVWKTKSVSDTELILSYLSKDGEEGYPGNLQVTTSYTLTDSNELVVIFEATTDKATPVNFTHHSFFNLHGAGNGSITNHILQINASYCTPILEDLIPTGEIVPVDNTPFDFRKPTTIGARINEENEQLKHGFGYDHNFVLDGKDIKKAAYIYEPISGRSIEVTTNEPAMQLYSGNFFNGSDVGKQDKAYDYRTAFCLETQHFPDSPNHPNFPSTILKPGKERISICIYKFGIN